MSSIFYCIACDAEQPMVVEPRREKWNIQGEVLEFTIIIKRCPLCGCWETIGPMGADIALEMLEERKKARGSK